MKCVLLSMTALGAVIAATIAFAADVTNTIKSIDLKARTITLADSKVYVLPANLNPANYKVGQKVKVIFTQQGGKNLVTGIVMPSD